jgi:uncharacterized protein
MSLSMHAVSAPAFIRTLNAMLVWLDKAEAHAQARGFDSANYLGLRLAPDMLPLTRQVQIASDGIKGCVARLGTAEIPKWDDTEASIDDLRARIRKTLDFVQSVPAAQIDGSEERAIVVKMRAGDVQFTGQSYLLGFVLPNLYFHATTMYDLLRQAGVPLGKKDFLGS